MYNKSLALSTLRKPLDSSSAVVFPVSVDDLRGSLDFDYIPAQVELPTKLFQQRKANSSEKGGGSMWGELRVSKGKEGWIDGGWRRNREGWINNGSGGWV